ncbi:MAG: hypothetical protein FJW69_03630 [Actinobacteria bacterium]|nr:hypothetical protein [Actinomycetota bacterium]MBM3712109.1 hypothetical protein [Actinomycetota bacterium]
MQEKVKKKKYNKYTGIADRFPFIIIAVIFAIAIIFIFQFKDRYPLTFFSGKITETQQTESASYSILITSPANNQVFNFVSKNEYVPVEVKSEEIEGFDYRINIVINDKDTIKTFNSPPYKYDWKPPIAGEYVVVANLVDSSNEILSSSNSIKFVVNYTVEETAVESITSTDSSDTISTSEDGSPTIMLRIYEGPVYSEFDDICYYRVEAVVTGDPEPTVTFSKDDSSGVWGPLKTQINLKRNSPNYTLTAIAKNSVGESVDSISLYWGCGPLTRQQ